jgi:hypothetical protein
MTNNQTNKGKDVDQSEMYNGEKQNQQQKKGFEQGNGNNSTTADPKKMDEYPGVKQENEKGKQGQGTLNSNDQSKTTNHDPKITNDDEEIEKDPKTETEKDDDKDEKSPLEGYTEEPEIDTPVRKTEETEKKIPKMS